MSLQIIDQELLDEASKIDAAARAYFYETRCRGCLGTALQKKRDCTLLLGYSKPGCRQMDAFVRKQRKGVSDKILGQILSTLSHYTELRKDLLERRF